MPSHSPARTTEEAERQTSERVEKTVTDGMAGMGAKTRAETPEAMSHGVVAA